MDNILLEQVIRDTLILENISTEKGETSFRKKYMEMIPIVDDDGNAIGAAPRGLAHRLGLRHVTVFVVITRDDGHLLLQTRGASSRTPPRLDISVGGHVSSEDNDVVGAACREAQEELGIILHRDRLRSIVEYNRDSPISFTKPHERNRERRFLYEYKLNISDITNLRAQFEKRLIRSEVSNFEWFSVDQVVSALDTGRVADGLGTNFLHWSLSKSNL